MVVAYLVEKNKEYLLLLLAYTVAQPEVTKVFAKATQSAYYRSISDDSSSSGGSRRSSGSGGCASRGGGGGHHGGGSGGGIR